MKLGEKLRMQGVEIKPEEFPPPRPANNPKGENMTLKEMLREIGRVKKELSAQGIAFPQRPHSKMRKDEAEQYLQQLQALLAQPAAAPATAEQQAKSGKGRPNRERFVLSLPEGLRHFNVALEIPKLGLAGRPRKVSNKEMQFSSIPSWGLARVSFIQAANNNALVIRGIPTKEFLEDPATFRKRIEQDLSQALRGAQEFKAKQEAQQQTEKPQPAQAPTPPEPQILAEQLKPLEERLSLIEKTAIEREGRLTSLERQFQQGQQEPAEAKAPLTRFKVQLEGPPDLIDEMAERLSSSLAQAEEETATEGREEAETPTPSLANRLLRALQTLIKGNEESEAVGTVQGMILGAVIILAALILAATFGAF